MTHEQQSSSHDYPELPLPDSDSETIMRPGYGTIDATEASKAISDGFYSNGYVLSSEASVDA